MRGVFSPSRLLVARGRLRLSKRPPFMSHCLWCSVCFRGYFVICELPPSASLLFHSDFQQALLKGCFSPYCHIDLLVNACGEIYGGWWTGENHQGFVEKVILLAVRDNVFICQLTVLVLSFLSSPRRCSVLNLETCSHSRPRECDLKNMAITTKSWHFYAYYILLSLLKNTFYWNFPKGGGVFSSVCCSSNLHIMQCLCLTSPSSVSPPPPPPREASTHSSRTSAFADTL